MGSSIFVPEEDLLRVCEEEVSEALFAKAAFFFVLEHMGENFTLFLDEEGTNDVSITIFREDGSTVIFESSAVRSARIAVTPMLERLSNMRAIIGTGLTRDDLARFIVDESTGNKGRPE
ncbi:MAG: hypothetical protein Q8Q05_03930 [bacterium]|nr:hypothetical protein [bacterium]